MMSMYWGSRSCLPSWTHLVLISLGRVLGLCHSFKGCALPRSLLLQNDNVMIWFSLNIKLYLSLNFAFIKILLSSSAGMVDVNLIQVSFCFVFRIYNLFQEAFRVSFLCIASFLKFLNGFEIMLYLDYFLMIFFSMLPALLLFCV